MKGFNFKRFLLLMCMLGSTVFPIIGCHKQAHVVKPTELFVIPRECILGGIVDKSRCVAAGPDNALCDGVLVKMACVKAVKR